MAACTAALRGITKQYKDFTLGPVDMTVPAGSIVGLIGENGAGKTTLRISVITTKRAYEDLERDGFILTQQGRGSFVAAQNPALLREEHLKKVEDCLQGAVDAARLGGIGYDEVAETLRLLREG